ncbi:ShlB/FhaC/HecB family hemolysin secretion/activation protein [Allomuricauda sp. d1]|uniref:ShlB/FhaC/HecB family hemolysin secretion/activation protein n=1 Tax=Allomuricauda sp. d1 TaxID=3136725 RepID=UPI0031DB44F2
MGNIFGYFKNKPLNPLFRISMLFSMALITSCATLKEQRIVRDSPATEKSPTHTFFIAGGLGNAENNFNPQLLEAFKTQLQQSGANSTVIFTGDNITPEEQNWEADKALLNKHLNLVNEFKGNTIFIPGNNEWKAYDADKVERVEDFVKDIDKDDIKFFPENACPIEHKVINENLDLILIDSKWFITNWSRVEDINQKCTDIVTRRRFAEELEDKINDAQDKNILIAMHHPVFSNGMYAGNISAKQHLVPLPVLGTLWQGINDLGAFDPDHLNSRRYNYLRILVSALAQQSDRITIVSGHEESLQYLTGGDIHQIISGSLGSKDRTNRNNGRITAIGGSLEFKGKYTRGTQGFAKLDYFGDGSSKVTFFREDDFKNGITMDVLSKKEAWQGPDSYAKSQKTTKTDKVLQNPEAYEKSGFHKFLWGDRYRAYFGKEVTAPVVYLDTLYGGLKVTKEGGGHQSFSLRLEDENGRQYAMRSLRKSALKFLKFQIPAIAYNQEEYRDTWAEEVVSDFFTSAHPYMQLVINPLAKAVGINHSDNDLFYVPKQETLGQFNETYGDELYFIERRPSEEQANYKGYRRTFDESGKVEDYESTTDMLEKIKSDESYVVDERNYIRARIFDFLIGDWDRHQDQWRWIEYETNNDTKEFMPIPRDRDNAFPRFDGAALKVVKLFVPTARRWQTFDAEFDNIKWLAMAGNGLDRTLTTRHGIKTWEEEALAIKNQLEQTDIEKAFEKLPAAIQDSTAKRIQRALLARLEQLPKVAKEYAEYLNRTVAIKGTEKDDLFEIEHLPDGSTKVVVKRILTDEKNPVFYERVFRADETKELLVYGLGDDDRFVVSGDLPSLKIRLIGGYGEDVYDIQNTKRVKIFDWKHEKIVFEDKTPSKQLSDLYKTNSFHWRYFKPDTQVLLPTLGFRTDDGVFLGAKYTYNKNGLNGNPFRQQHSLAANYYFTFKALEMQYSGAWGNIFPNWNFIVDGYYTSDLYARNFFGLGNETMNNEDALDIDFYRARLRQLKASVGIQFHTLKIRALYESFSTAEVENRLFTPANLGEEVFNTQHFAGGEVSLYYKRDDARDFPAKSIYMGLTTGYKFNLDLEENRFGYAHIKLGAQHKLISSGSLALAAEAAYYTNIGPNEVFFYHAPALGGANGLRGFRDERFSGNSYFYQSTDLRLRLKQYVTAVSPVTIGMFGGFDYGRVWAKNEDSNTWHTSQGGGLWISSLKALTFSLGYFNSKENNLIQVGFVASF